MGPILNLLSIFSTIFAIIYAYFYFGYKYWENRKIPYLPPKFPLGNSKTLIKKAKNYDLECMDWYVEIKKRKLSFAGIYLALRPVLVVIDPKYIKDILITSFSHFVDRGMYYNEKVDPLSGHLFALDGADWRTMRMHLTPTFTSGKMKMMFSSVLKCSDSLIDAMEKAVDRNEDLEIREYLSCYTTDVIGVCAYGLDCGSFTSPDAEYREIGKGLFKINFWNLVANFTIANWPKLAKILGLKAVHEDVTRIVKNVVKKTLKYRETNQINRPDFLQLVTNMKNEGKITLNQLFAQVFLFFVAGSDTSTSAMNMTLYELAKNPDVQEKLRKEIIEVLIKNNGEITYESIKEMVYLQQVFEETLRIYPSVPIIFRKSVKDYKLPDTDLVIEKGTSIVIPLISLQRDKDYFPDPLKFDPDRFAPGNKNNITNFTHLPFGDGPRHCIGLRFGTMQYKIGIIRILREFRIKLSPKMTEPLIIDRKFFLLTTTKPLYVTAEKL